MEDAEPTNAKIRVATHTDVFHEVSDILLEEAERFLIKAANITAPNKLIYKIIFRKNNIAL